MTVKTRLGWDENSIKIVEVAKRLQDVGIKALTIHGNQKAMYKGEANWEYIAKVRSPQIQMPIFGNGDIDSSEKALEYKTGIMLMNYDWKSLNRISLDI